jgi:hypothetical protein
MAVDNEGSSIAKFTLKAPFTEKETTLAIFINQSLTSYGVTSAPNASDRALNRLFKGCQLSIKALSTREGKQLITATDE